jgi:hypothetical protein
MATTKRKYVVVRTYSAGVEVGELVERNGKEVLLANARKLWSWSGSFTLHGVAAKGVGKGSRLSVAVLENLVTEAIEVITCSPEAEKNLREVEAHDPD